MKPKLKARRRAEMVADEAEPKASCSNSSLMNEASRVVQEPPSGWFVEPLEYNLLQVGYTMSKIYKPEGRTSVFFLELWLSLSVEISIPKLY